MSRGCLFWFLISVVPSVPLNLLLVVFQVRTPASEPVGKRESSERSPATGAARAISAVEEWADVSDRPARYLVAGEGFPLVLLHALGENALDWTWLMTALPGISGTSGTLPDYSPRSFALFVEAFLDSVGLGRRISPALSILTLPGYREATVAFCKTPHGARQRARILAVLLFAHRDLARAAWRSEQYRLWSPAFVERPEHFTDVLAGFLAETVRP